MKLRYDEEQTEGEVRKWDRVGILLSSICVFHCLVAPFLTLSLPYWIYTIHYAPFHLMIALFIIPVGLFAFWNGYRRHHNATIFVLGATGLFLVLVSLVGPTSRNQLQWNDLLTIAGSLCLILAHFFNRRAIKSSQVVK